VFLLLNSALAFIHTSQRQIRQGSEKLHDHVCKALNEVNFIRCALIPPNSDKDWRVFQETTAEHIQSLAREGRLPSEYIHYSRAKAIISLVSFALDTQKGMEIHGVHLIHRRK